MTVSLEALMLLANKSKIEKDDLSVLETNTEVEQSDFMSLLREELQIKREQERDAALKQAVAGVLELMEMSTKTVDSLVKTIRDLRRREKEELAYLQRINVARAYGESTSNFVPLYKLLNSNVSTLENVGVPAGWVAPKAPKAAKAAKQ